MSLLQQLANAPRRIIKPRHKPAPDGCPSPRSHIENQLDLFTTNEVESPHEETERVRIGQAEKIPGPTIPELVAAIDDSHIAVDDLSPVSVPRILPAPNSKAKVRPKTKRPRKRKERRKC